MENTLKNHPDIAFIGFGEAAQAFVTGWAGETARVITAFDLKTNGPERETKQRDYQHHNVTGHDNIDQAVNGAEVIFSFVTADQALIAAQNAAPHLAKNALYFDCNSCAPQTKQLAAKIINAAGGRYMDVAVMAPVHPKLHQTPILVSGASASETLTKMTALNMNAKDAGGDIGTASAIKLCRSIMVKGLEALTAEMMISARQLGVESPVIQSLDKSHPGFDWEKRSAHSLERMRVHGVRRAAEMREAAAMVETLGIPARMALATVDWHQQIGDLALGSSTKNAAIQADQIAKAIK